LKMLCASGSRKKAARPRPGLYAGNGYDSSFAIVRESTMNMLARGAVALALGGAAPLHAQTGDFGDFLSGRWGDAKADWKDQTAEWIYAPCNIRHPRATAAYEFSGKASELTVRTTGHQGQSTRLTPVVSPVKLAGPYDPSQSPETGNRQYLVRCKNR
jgi:hypothetical protein